MKMELAVVSAGLLEGLGRGGAIARSAARGA